MVKIKISEIESEPNYRPSWEDLDIFWTEWSKVSCLITSTNGFTCTRLSGHTGKHVAHTVGGSILSNWT